MDIIEYNRQAWNRRSAEGCEWSMPVDAEIIRAARQGEWSIILTPTRPVPKEWLGDIKGKDVLCLASGGGQQAPVLAAAGARVACYDLSDEQLAKDRLVAEREGLDIRIVQGDMRDLIAFGNESFDLIVHPISNCFVPDVRPVWRECYRVLKGGGSLLAGFMNPAFYLSDALASEEDGPLAICNKLPFCEPDDLNEAGLEEFRSSGRAAEFSHTLECQIGGQLEAGFVLAGFYEDPWMDSAMAISRYLNTTMATRAVKMR